MKNDTLKTVGAMTIVGGVLGAFILAPVIRFGLGYVGGMVLETIVGEKIVWGLNNLFDTTRFVPHLIPCICGTLATIGGYFKSTQTNNNR